jgi:hypothetical protein
MRYARICPNTNGWTSPSGGEKWSRLSFPGLNGFGFDEWLLGTPLITAGRFAGCKAGFIQGFTRYALRPPEDVSCYWIDGAAPRQAQFALVILNCQKLSPTDARAIYAQYKRGGFIQAMANSLNALNPPLNPVFPADPLDMFNVVFKDGDAKLIATPHPIINRGFQYTRLFY